MNQYEDMLYLPHPEPKKRSRMPQENRAAQFAPFEALVGHKDSILETARLTDERKELDEHALEVLNREITKICQNIGEKHPVQITYFQPDEKKTGGAYRTIRGVVTLVDAKKRCIIMEDGTQIPMDEVFSLEAEDAE